MRNRKIITKFEAKHNIYDMKKNILPILFGTLAAIEVCAQNPYLPMGEFIPDGEPYVLEDPDHPGKKRVYVYGSHDVLKSEYCGKDQVVWSAPVEDLTQWRYDGVIFESKRDAQGNLLHEDGSGDVLYAPDLAWRKENGKTVYYLYPNNQNGGRNGMIAKSDRPDGPFQVCNWSTTNPKETEGVLRFDPAVFVDDDGKVYGYWGFEESYAAELDPATMATVKPGTEVVKFLIPGRHQDEIYRFFEASSIRKIKDKYVFIYSRWTKEGDFGLGGTNYTLAYCYSNHPLGPYTYGGTIIDCRGREQAPDGSVRITATCTGNTHGSICEINGQWYVFYHRQTGTNEYSRQAMVSPIQVEVEEGPQGKVRISEAEYTSEGFHTNGLDPYKRYPAGIASYYTGPGGAYQSYPNMHYSGSYPQPVYGKFTKGETRFTEENNQCPMVHNTGGSVVGYKYFNLDKAKGKPKLTLLLEYTPEGTEGSIEVFADRPSQAEGGVKLATLQIAAQADMKPTTARLDVSQLTSYSGKHALYLVFKSKAIGKSVCRLNALQFQ